MNVPTAYCAKTFDFLVGSDPEIVYPFKAGWGLGLPAGYWGAARSRLLLLLLLWPTYRDILAHAHEKTVIKISVGRSGWWVAQTVAVAAR